MRKIWLIVWLFFCLPLWAQDTIPFKVMFYNVENLFDTQKDSLKNDDEFLPHSIRGWSHKRYKKKLADIARVITAAGEWEPPALVGLCEVENDRVMRDLVKYSPLKESGYRYVMTDSRDSRGIDVALLYQRDKFGLLSWRAVPAGFEDKSYTSRDILHVTGVVPSRDTLDVFIVHFPSRSSGEKETEKYRLQAAGTLRHMADSLFSVRLSSRILIMGDFNDYPSNRSIAQVLDARPIVEATEQSALYHLMRNKSKQKNFGSYKYKGEWGLLDHLLVSGSLLDTSSHFYTTEEQADVFRPEFLLQKDEKHGGVQPRRTYHGMKYQGGFSDHLPVCADFVLFLPVSTLLSSEKDEAVID